MVACAWDGQTYIIDHNRTVVRFQVDENIRAFCAGGTVASELSYSSLGNVLESDWLVSIKCSPNTNGFSLVGDGWVPHSHLDSFLIWMGNFIYFYVSECMSVYHGCAVPTKARSGYHILRIYSTDSWVLEIEPALLKEEPVCWAISPGPLWQCGMRRKHSEGSVSKCVKNGMTVGECFQLIMAGCRKTLPEYSL